MKTRKITTVILAMLVSGIVTAQSFNADVEKSTVKWHGKKVTGEHFGFIQLKEGSFEIADNRITKGSFVIDMTTISNTDLEDAGYNAKLVGHLKSDDFFGVDKHPTAKLVIKEATEFNKGVAKAKAHLTIKGITHPVEFEVTKKGEVYGAFITVDRSKYNVRYGSTSFFDNLGDKAIYDDFTLDVKLITK